MAIVVLTSTGAGTAAVADQDVYIVPEDVVLGDDNFNAEFDTDGFDDVTLIVEGTIANNEGGSQAPIYVDVDSVGTQIFIEEGGFVTGATAVTSSATDVFIVNKGTLSSTGTTLSLAGTAVVENHGTISAENIGGSAIGAINSTGDGSRVTNYGEITCSNRAIESFGNDFLLTNFGTIVGQEVRAVLLTGNDSRVINSGALSSALSIGINIRGDENVVLNSGEISGETGLYFQSASQPDITLSEVENSGSIEAVETALLIEEGSHILSNSGLISGGATAVKADLGTSGSLTLVNSGTIESRDLSEAIYSEDGDDLIVNTGQILGDVVTGLGDDTILTTGGGLITGRVEAGSGNDVVTGGSSSDEIDGGADDDFITGGDGVDDLAGGDGIDIILGGTGADTITGGEGFDFLLGEEGADVFLFTAISDSATGEADSILDFEQGADIIDLYTIETAIAFLGTGAFTGSGGAELRTTNVGGVLSIVDFDVSGNGVADMQIIVYGALDMTRADFGL